MALFGISVEEKPWYYALGVGIFVAALLAGAVHWFVFKPMQEEIAAKKVELEGLKQEIAKGRAAERKLAQFREEVKRLELELAKLLQILPSKRNTEELIKRIETLTRQGDFTLLEVHARRVHPEGVLRGVADRHPDPGHVPQPRALLRPDEPLLANHQRRGHEDQRARATFPASRSPRHFVAKTFIYTGDEPGAQPAAGRPGAGPPAAGKAGANAQTLKGRAEGGGVE